MEEDIKAVVIDMGSGLTKAGFSGDDVQKETFPTVLGRKKGNRVGPGLNEQSIWCGDDVAQRRDLDLDVSYPIQRGLISNSQDWEKMCSHAFNDGLRIAPEEHPVFLTETARNSRANRETMTQIMFETFNVPAFYTKCDSVLALLATGRVTGVCVSSGEGVTNVVPIHEGVMVSKAAQRLNLAGSDVTMHLIKHLKKDGVCDLSNNVDLARELKKKMCFVALDYSKEAKQHMEKEFSLPDGKTIKVRSSTRMKCTETLFKPARADVKSDGIDELTNKAIQACDADIQKDLYKNIVLAGGNTLLSNLERRMIQEISEKSNADVKITAEPYRQYLSWIGGSILSSTEEFQQHWITKMDYDEHGEQIVHKKCVS